MPPPLNELPPRVDWITLAVDDLQRSRVFYEALGFGPAEVMDDDLVLFQLEMGTLALIGIDRLSKDVGIQAGRPGAVLLSRNLQSEEAVHGMIERLIQGGGTETREVGTTPWGTVSGWILDPDGHPWEICFNPRIQYSSQEEPAT
jgi:predicted lactoylglutathione lyase